MRDSTDDILALMEDGRRESGTHFSSQDYLSLASHPQIIAAAKRAMDEFGVHSAGSLIRQRVELRPELVMTHALGFGGYCYAAQVLGRGS